MSEKKQAGKQEAKPSYSQWARERTARGGDPSPASSAETDRLGREQQRRATAYARAQGQL